MSNLFGERFRKLREAQGVSQTELARRLGHRSNGYVYDVEHGHFIPPDERLPEVARALGVPAALLQDLALESRLERLGVKDREFIALLKDYPRLSRQDKQAVLDAYRRVREARDPHGHAGPRR